MWDVPRARPRKQINRKNTMDTQKHDGQARSTLATGSVCATPKTTALFERQDANPHSRAIDCWEEMTEHARTLERIAQRMADRIRADADQTEGIAKLFDEDPPEYAVAARALVAEWDAISSPNMEITHTAPGSGPLEPRKPVGG